ncbi:MAG: glycosyltransferase family 4 protein [Candidatus Leucobacter sulfamidivorax]|nr:glycosyltransferase family 4 protein [Candidatus Leucobacter sulfamidivorax]
MPPVSPTESTETTGNTDRLRILIGCDTFAPDVNGAARFAERLAAGLVQRGHRVFIVAPGMRQRRTPPAIEVIEGQPMTVYRLPAVRWKPHDWLRFVWPWRSKYYARRVLQAVQPDIVHIQSHIVIGRGLARIAKQRGIPVVATNHVMAENIIDFTTLPPFIDKLFLKLAWDDAERTFKMARAVTTPTRRAAQFLERTVDIDEVIPVSCGIERANYRPDPSPRGEHRILFVGRLTTEKHVDVTLKAIARIVPEIDVRFDVVGGGDQMRPLLQLTEKLGLQDRVTFHGRIDDGPLVELYSRASVFVISSIAELQSIATMEAMASGLPIIAADAVALPHLVHHGENGYLFEPGNDAELAARLTEVLTAPHEEWLRMQRASLDGVVVHDITRTLDTFEALYRGEAIPE